MLRRDTTVSGWLQNRIRNKQKTHMASYSEDQERIKKAQKRSGMLEN